MSGRASSPAGGASFEDQNPSAGIALAPAAIQTVAGVTIDRKGYNEATFVVMTGLKDATTFTSLVAKAQHDDDGAMGSPTDFAAGDIKHGEVTVSIVAESTGAVLHLDMRGTTERYVRLYFTVTASGGNAAINASASYSLGAPQV